MIAVKRSIARGSNQLIATHGKQLECVVAWVGEGGSGCVTARLAWVWA